jgi:hypothetical protein
LSGNQHDKKLGKIWQPGARHKTVAIYAPPDLYETKPDPPRQFDAPKPTAV